MTGLKLVEAGVPKAQLALLAVPMVPLQILLPLIISKYTAGPRPLDIFYKAFPLRYSHSFTGSVQTGKNTYTDNSRLARLLDFKKVYVHWSNTNDDRMQGTCFECCNCFYFHAFLLGC